VLFHWLDVFVGCVEFLAASKLDDPPNLCYHPPLRDDAARAMLIRFEIFKSGERVTDFVPVGAMAMGPDSVPVPGSVTFSDNTLRVGPVDQATGVALLWDCGPLGAFHLETTRLAPRVRAYNLNVEIARAKLMKLLQRVEEWGLLNHVEGEATLHRLRSLQMKFAESLVLDSKPGEASKIADEVLADCITLGNELSQQVATLTLNRRQATNTFARYVFGCRVDWSQRNQRIKELFVQNFDYAVVPFTWSKIQPREEVFDTTALDEWIDFLFTHRLPIIAGPLIDFSTKSIPNWAFIWEHDFDVLRDLMIDFVRKTVQRYRKHVSVWNVVGGLHEPSISGLSFEQTIELTRLLVAQVKAMLPQARTLVTIRDPFAEHHSKIPPGVPPMLYAETVAQAGVNCDGFGLEICTGVPSCGCYTRDLFQFSAMIDRLSVTGKPIYITSLSAPSRATPDPADSSEGRHDPSKAGRFGESWSPVAQREFFEAFSRIALGKPYVESVTWADFTDAGASSPGGGLLDDMLQPRPALEALKAMRQTYQRRERK